MMERTGIEPVTSGLQTHPLARPHLTPTDRNGMTTPNPPSHRTQPDTVRRRSARTRLAPPLPKWTTIPWLCSFLRLTTVLSPTPFDWPQRAASTRQLCHATATGRNLSNRFRSRPHGLAYFATSTIGCDRSIL